MQQVSIFAPCGLSSLMIIMLFKGEK